jgi:hypothetical protein
VQPAPKTHLLSIFQIALSGLGILFLLPTAAGLFVLAAASGIAPNIYAQETLSLVNLAWMALLTAVLLAPALVLALLRVFNRPLPSFQHEGKTLSLSLLIAWPFVLAAGYALTQNERLAWLLLPPIQLAAVAIPLAWFVLRGRRGLRHLSAQQNWGTVSFSLVVTPFVTIFAELVVGGILLVGLGVWLMSDPQWMEMFFRASQRLANDQIDAQLLTRVILPLVMNPQVIVGLLVLTAGIIPLLEEFLKPLALWLLAGKRLTPAQGFSGGLVAGAMFGLYESLGLLAASAGGQDWLTLVLGRTGTGLLHTVTTALVGYGLACAWQDGRYVRLALSYFCAALLHGTWNLFGILMGLLPVGGLPELSLTEGAAQIAPLALAILSVVLMLILLRGSSVLREKKLSI